MAGIFAPVLDEIAPASSPIQPAQPPASGQGAAIAAKGVADLFSSAASMVPRYQAEVARIDKAEKEALNHAGLVTLSTDLNRLYEQRESGDVSLFSLKRAANRRVNEYLTQFPENYTEASKLAKTITGIDVDITVPVFDPDISIMENMNKYAESPEGAAALINSLNPDGSMNMEKFNEQMFSDFAQKSRLSNLKEQAEAARAEGTIDERVYQVAERAIVDDVHTYASDQANILMGQFAKEDLTTPEAMSKAVDTIDQLIMLADAKFDQQAAAVPGALGASANRDQARENALKPLLTIRDMLASQDKNIMDFNKRVKNYGEIRAAEMSQALFGIATDGTIEAVEFALARLAMGNDAQVKEKLKVPSKVLSFMENPFGFAAPEETEDLPSTESESIFTDQEAMASLRNLSDEELRDSSKGLETYFHTTPIELLASEENRQEAVQKFAVGRAALNILAGNNPVSIDTLNTLYSNEFIRRYKEIIKHDDISSVQMQSYVKYHLYKEFDTRISNLELRITTEGEPTALFPFELIFDGDEIVFSRVGGDKADDSAITTMGPTGRPRYGFERSAHIRQNLDNINKLVMIANKFPELNLKETFTKRLTKPTNFSMSSNTGGGAIASNLPFVSSEEEYKALPPGSQFIYQDADGLTVTLTKRE